MTVVDSISADEAAAHQNSGAALVVDMRPQIVRHQGSLPGAVVVEPTELTSAFAPDSPDRVPAGLDTEIAVVSVRSEAPRIAERIAELGYTNVHYVDGGFRAFCLATGKYF